MDPQDPNAAQTPVETNTNAPAPAPAPAPASPEKPAAKGGYGKRPMWQWILLYVIVGAIVYALIYFLFIHKSGSSY